MTETYYCLVKPQLEKKVHKTYPVFVAKKYRYLENIVGASHYLIKVSVSNPAHECVHLYVVQVVLPPPVDSELTKYQLNKTEDDPLVPI
ncbi:cystatin-A1-like isoform X2 [Mauremys reevesii]|uniref:cystatin-A1-like isoform X2 n=1 Tax=Mauremys reevesii TaxID=260615 RepID=UPI00193F7672|nr:cystatin-A1-like isoform X2 [Mauremys reevesii]